MIKAKVNGEKVYEVELDDNQGRIDGKDFQLDVIEQSQNQLNVIIDNRSLDVIFLSVDKAAKLVSVMIEGKIYEVELSDKYDELLKQLGMEKLDQAQHKVVKAPMPGLVLEVSIKIGQEVEQNDPLLILEAMKMENVIKSPSAGKIAGVHIGQGQTVEKNELLVEFE